MHGTAGFPSLSVFFPAYNDAPSLPGLLAKTFAVLEAHVADYEVIVVNDGSYDDTAAVLEQLRGQYGPRLRVVTHPENRGYGGALRSGFEAATKEFVFYTDGDGQYDVGELPRLLELVGPHTGLVNGYKLERHDPAHRIWIGKAYNFCARLLFRIRIRDIDCDYRLIRRALLDEAPSHFDERHDLRGTGAEAGNDGLRGGGNGSAPLSATVRKIAVLPAAVAGDDALRIGAAVGAGGGSAAHGVLKGGRREPRAGAARTR